MVLAATGDSVMALTWTREDLARLGISAVAGGGGLIEEAEGQLEEYFQGKRTRFDLPFRLQGTPFQQRVWTELARIPYGNTWSYRELAVRVGSPAAVRAVGSANARNPVCIFIPCHRVVRASGELGGYAGGLENKARLLRLEGASLSSPV
jgi:methylated-DNA-[protein]-cysteine S-methyltransferase